VRYPVAAAGSQRRCQRTDAAAAPAVPPLDPATLSRTRQLIVFEAPECPYCASSRPTCSTTGAARYRWPPPCPRSRRRLDAGKDLFATPTIVLFEQGKEVPRYTGYNGEQARFWVGSASAC
jgi:peptide methionine sulfoxide reductase msrA/msrB